jgi:hypothetical protein
MEPATIRRYEYQALRTKLTARPEEQLIIPFSSMRPEQRDLVRDIEITRMIQTGPDKVASNTGIKSYDKSCSRFVGQAAKFCMDGEWFSCTPVRIEEEKSLLSDETHQKLVSLWHGRDWTKTLMTRSDARDKDGLALLSFAKFAGLIRPGRLKCQVTDRQILRYRRLPALHKTNIIVTCPPSTHPTFFSPHCTEDPQCNFLDYE